MNCDGALKPGHTILSSLFSMNFQQVHIIWALLERLCPVIIILSVCPSLCLDDNNCLSNQIQISQVSLREDPFNLWVKTVKVRATGRVQIQTIQCNSNWNQ